MDSEDYELDVNNVTEEESMNMIIDIAPDVEAALSDKTIQVNELPSVPGDTRRTMESSPFVHLSDMDHPDLSRLKNWRSQEENEYWSEQFFPEEAMKRARLDAWKAMQASWKKNGGRIFQSTSSAGSKPAQPPAQRPKFQDEEPEEGEIVEDDANLIEVDLVKDDMAGSSGEQSNTKGSNIGNTSPLVFEKIKKKRKYSSKKMKLATTRTLLTKVDGILWSAYNTPYSCNGGDHIDSDGLPFELPKLSARRFSELFESRTPCSASTASKKLGFAVPKNPTSESLDGLTTLAPHPCTIMDDENIPLIHYLPSFHSKSQTEEFTKYMLKFGEEAKLSIKQADHRGRGTSKSYVVRDDHPSGCTNLAPSWTSLGHKKNDPRPSAAVISGVKGGVVNAFTIIQKHFNDIRKFNVLMNYALRVLDPNSFWEHVDLKCGIQQKVPAARAFGPNDPSMATGV
ncbi:hypothetical protein FRC11_005168 [Ceratobasidium sp. 423]|nr:hypothetical protein FRC11_005168 [Ceratobasidium sp. 423]